MPVVIANTQPDLVKREKIGLCCTKDSLYMIGGSESQKLIACFQKYDFSAK